jgi:hypothetical protein
MRDATVAMGDMSDSSSSESEESEEDEECEDGEEADEEINKEELPKKPPRKRSRINVTFLTRDQKRKAIKYYNRGKLRGCV